MERPPLPRLRCRPVAMVPFDLEKAVQHKYIRRYKVKGKWRYVYPDKKGGGGRHSGDHHVAAHHVEVQDEHLHAGASFALGPGRGHLIVEKVEGGKVHYYNDDPKGDGSGRGKTKTSSIEAFRLVVEGVHKEAATRHAQAGWERRKDTLRRAERSGSGKHIARARQELEGWEEKYHAALGLDPPPPPEQVKATEASAQKSHAAAVQRVVEDPKIEEKIKNGTAFAPTDPPNSWDIPGNMLTDLVLRRVISGWEKGFLAGKRFKPLSSFSQKQQVILERIQDKLEDFWDTLGPKKREEIQRAASPPQGAGENSHPLPLISQFKKEGFLELHRRGVISQWDSDFIADNHKRKNFSEKQKEFVDRIVDKIEAAWKGSMSRDQQHSFIETYTLGFAGVDAPPAEQIEAPLGMEKFLKRGYRLRGYQKEFVSRALSQPRVLGALEMGLGKTLGTIALYHHLQEQDIKQKMIVTAPRSAMESWRKEFSDHSDARVLFLTQGPKGREKALAAWKSGEYDVMVLTHRMASKEDLTAYVDKRTLLTVDEVHKIRNPRAGMTKAISALSKNAGRVVGLTGTPQPNRPEDLFHVCDLIHPGSMGQDKWDFAWSYCKVKTGDHGSTITGYDPELRSDLQRDFRRLAFVKHYSDPDLENTLPPRHQIHVNVGMDAATKKAYNAQLSALESIQSRVLDAEDNYYRAKQAYHMAQSAVREMGLGGTDITRKIPKETAASLKRAQQRMEDAKAHWDKVKEEKGGAASPLTTVLRLRQISVSPGLLDPEHSKESHKIESVADATAQHLEAQPDRGAVLFGEFNDGLEQARKALEARGIHPDRIGKITGSTTNKQRQILMDQLNSGELQVLLANTRSMDTGANLQGNANFVGILDTPWNPGILTQAIGRVHRGGQKNQVIVYHPVSTPIEEYQRDVLLKKLASSATATGGQGMAEEALEESLRLPRTPEEIKAWVEQMKIK